MAKMATATVIPIPPKSTARARSPGSRRRARFQAAHTTGFSR